MKFNHCRFNNGNVHEILIKHIVFQDENEITKKKMMRNIINMRFSLHFRPYPRLEATQLTSVLCAFLFYCHLPRPAVIVIAMNIF